MNSKSQIYASPVDNSNNNQINTKTSPTTTTTIYKDDCFGFTTFLAGFAVQDYTFTAIFISLSLIADLLTRVKWLPSDPKRPEIVDRKVPGVIAAVTLALSMLVKNAIFVDDNVRIDTVGRDPAIMVIQLAVCSFSIITAFLDIRWRDRFDYPEENQ